MAISNELNKTRLRLSRAEEYELKYGVIMKEKSLLEENEARRDEEMRGLMSEREVLSLNLKERGDRNRDNAFQKERLVKDREIWREKALEAEERCKMVVAEEQAKANETIERELLVMRRNFTETGQDYKSQITRLKRQLDSKQTFDSTNLVRYDKQAKERQQEIIRLEETIHKMRDEYLSMIDQKNKETERVKDKFQQIMTT